MRPEETIEKKFVAECRKIGVKAPKFEKAEKGAPDRIVLIPGGKPLFFEFKAPGANASPHQIEWMKMLRRLGYYAEIVMNWEDPLAMVKAALKK